MANDMALQYWIRDWFLVRFLKYLWKSTEPVIYSSVYPSTHPSIMFVCPYYLNSETSHESLSDLSVTLNQLCFTYDNEWFIICGVSFYFMKPGVYHLLSNQHNDSKLFWSSVKINSASTHETKGICSSQPALLPNAKPRPLAEEWFKRHTWDRYAC